MNEQMPQDKYDNIISSNTFIEQVITFISPYKYTFIIDLEDNNSKINREKIENSKNTKNTKPIKENNIAKIMLYENNNLIKYEEVYGKHTKLDILYFLLLQFKYDIYDSFKNDIIKIQYIIKNNALNDYDKLVNYMINQGCFTL